GNETLKRIADLIIGAVLGATMAHFLIDAGAWKLSKPLQRMYIGKRFAFMFAKLNHRLPARFDTLSDALVNSRFFQTYNLIKGTTTWVREKRLRSWVLVMWAPPPHIGWPRKNSVTSCWSTSSKECRRAKD